jgi:hypothetical protein
MVVPDANRSETEKIRKMKGTTADYVCTFRQDSVTNGARRPSTAAVVAPSGEIDLGQHVDQVRHFPTNLERVHFANILRLDLVECLTPATFRNCHAAIQEDGVRIDTPSVTYAVC